MYYFFPPTRKINILRIYRFACIVNCGIIPPYCFLTKMPGMERATFRVKYGIGLKQAYGRDPFVDDGLVVYGAYIRSFSLCVSLFISVFQIYPPTLFPPNAFCWLFLLHALSLEMYDWGYRGASA